MSEWYDLADEDYSDEALLEDASDYPYNDPGNPGEPALNGFLYIPLCVPVGTEGACDTKRHLNPATGRCEVDGKVSAGKRPLETGWQHKGTPERPEGNAGILMGKRHGLLGFDVDSPANRAAFGKWNLPATFTQRTGAGFHYIFRWPEGVEKLPGNVDGVLVRVNGQFVAAGSRHWSGREYRVHLAVPPAALPENFVKRMLGLGEDEDVTKPVPKPPLAERVATGGRTEAVTRIAGANRRIGVPEAVTLAAAQVLNKTTFDPPLPDSKVADTVAGIYSRYAPDEALAPEADLDGLVGKPSSAANGEEPAEEAAPRLVPADLARLLAEDLPEPEFLGGNRYLPAATKILAVGPAEAAKSICAMHWACKLSRDKIPVVFVSQENALVEDLRRLKRLGVDHEHFVFLSGAEIDLAVPGDVDALEELARSRRARLIVLDTLSAAWASKGEPNDAFTELDRAVFSRLRNRLECSVLIIDHTGFPQAFVNRHGVNAPRGASAKAQKVDVLVEFQAVGERTFKLSVAKYRLGVKRPKEVVLEVVDTDDSGLDIVEVVDGHITEAEREMADSMVDAIGKAGHMNSTQLKAAVPGRDTTKLGAMRLLQEEVPPRVTMSDGPVETKTGRKKGHIWQLATS